VKDYTFISGVHPTCFRLDYILVSHPLLLATTHTIIHPIVISDHVPVTLSSPKRTIPWRINNYSTANPETKVLLSKDIKEFFNNTDSVPNFLLVSEALKCFVRSWLISYNTARKKVHSKKTDELLSKIKTIEQIMKSTPSDSAWLELLRKKEYDDFTIEHDEFLISKANLHYMEQSEKAGHFLALRIKKQEAAKYISALVISDQGNIITDPTDIKNHFASFYISLYSSDHSFEFGAQFFQDITLPILTNAQVHTLNSPILVLEVQQVIDAMVLDKAP
uniref:Endonuclease/exonuclease/phosphatase domain-containing protein n=1 Tax=Latimeria chalumnae TaxID=7897 RepID=H3B2F6_LATCH